MYFTRSTEHDGIGADRHFRDTLNATTGPLETWKDSLAKTSIFASLRMAHHGVLRGR